MIEAAASLTHRVRPSAADAEGALVLIHGRGADEHDLFPLFDMLDPERRLLGVAPRGPLSLPPGGAHWYVVRRVGYPDPDTYGRAFAALDQWLGEVAKATGIPPEKTVLGGFSQGAVMSYALTLHRTRPRPAALLGLSGFVPEVEGFDPDFGKLDGLPVAIGHGTYDPVISAEFSRRARPLFEDAGADVLYRESAMEHTIDPSFVAELVPWLKKATSS